MSAHKSAAYLMHEYIIMVVELVSNTVCQTVLIADYMYS